jgi:hypothetical protein
MINIIFKNNTMIRILVIKLLNIILLLVFNDKISSEKLMVCLDNFISCSVCRELKILKNSDLGILFYYL